MTDLIYSSSVASVWQGNCLDVADVATVREHHGRQFDALIFDAPYSDRTHVGHQGGTRTPSRTFAEGDHRDATYARRCAAGLAGGRRDIAYASWSAATVRAFCDLWVPLTNGWVVTITDDVLAPAWRTSFTRHGLYPFAPLPLVETGSRVRMTGDGPSNWTCWVVVARPTGKPWSNWGTCRGGYVVPGEREADRVVGGKPLLAMQCIVDDYSRRGATVVDPCSGGGTTGRAAIALGRKFVGMEKDPGRAELTAKACAAVNVGQREMFLESGT